MSGASTTARRAAAWAAGRAPEVAVVAFGLLLRLSMAWAYDVSLGYDCFTHHQYVRYIVEHHALPPYNLNVEAYHPPLFYLLAALMEGIGFSWQATVAIAIASSAAQLLLLWWGLETYLRESRMARIVALAVASILPAAVHVAGMVSNEALNDAFCTGAIVLLPQVVARRGRAALLFAVAAGACLGLALLTKISGTMIVAAFLLSVTIALARRPARVELRERLPAVATVLAVALAICGWHYTRHKVLYGRFVLTGYTQWEDPDPGHYVPLLDRRPIGYVTNWSEDIYRDPYYPAASSPRPRFWPALVVTTFSDYFNFGYAPPPAAGTPAVTKNNKPLRASVVGLSRASVVGGTVLALACVVGWLIAMRHVWRRRDEARSIVVLVGLMATVGQLYFAVGYPYETMGPVKGAYMQFAGVV
jgi:4-amino-4-deoxy-L-arabinose transferase-like glycosyltransferase